MNRTANENCIYFKLFGGGISYRCSGEEEWISLNAFAAKGVGKKLASFLEYLILNHGKDISAEELINTFWPDESSSDPGSALKYTMHKTRSLLGQMFPHIENLLVTHRGHYTWNPDVKLELDTELFEKGCMEAKRYNSGMTSRELMNILELYSGDILTNNDAEWLLPLRIYYRTLYIDACKAVLEMLSAEDRWMDIIRICDYAYAKEPMVEEFTSYMMTGLIAIGQPEQAIEKYEAYRAHIWSELNLVPGDQVEMLNTAAVEAIHSNDETDIVRMLTEVEAETSAFLCSFSAFRSIVVLEARHMTRNKEESTILVVKAEKKKEERALPTTDIRRLEKVLLKTLRAGDPVARLNAGSYIVLLSGASEENARKVMERIDRAFHASYPRSRAHLDCRYYPLRICAPTEEV